MEVTYRDMKAILLEAQCQFFWGIPSSEGCKDINNLVLCLVMLDYIYTRSTSRKSQEFWSQEMREMDVLRGRSISFLLKCEEKFVTDSQNDITT